MSNKRVKFPDLLLAFLVITSACVDPRCPKGYSQTGDTCHRIKDGGSADARQDELDGGDASGDASQDADTADAPGTNDNDCPVDACAGGRCVDELDDYSCDCGEGYAGTGTKRCTEVDFCPEDACTPGGTCIDQQDWSCRCDPGFSGTGTKVCANVDDCEPDSCGSPGGVCQDGVNGFRCECTPGYSGDGCENDACTPNPCQHGGSCSRAAQGAICACAGTGYEGTTCQTEVNECASANACTYEAYPCVQTNPPGYTCQGQLADWPMPDAVVGSKTKPSYTASGFVVVDNVTGLAWHQYPPSSFVASECAAADGCTWEEAKAYCDKLVVSGYEDFRLPTKIELESIVDDTRAGPTIDPGAFPNADNASFWTSSPILGVANRAWTVNFRNGISFTNSTTEALRMRCVQTARRVPGFSTARYTVDSSAVPTATVTDSRTGLIWQQALNTTTREAGGAKTYCASLGTGWRLPTKKELLTLVNPTIAPSGSTPSIDPAFVGTPVDTNFWSSSPAADREGQSWAVNVSGTAVTGPDTTLSRVRCVR